MLQQSAWIWQVHEPAKGSQRAHNARQERHVLRDPGSAATDDPVKVADKLGFARDTRQFSRAVEHHPDLGDNHLGFNNERS
jgi:hypothetical protein